MNGEDKDHHLTLLSQVCMYRSEHPGFRGSQGSQKMNTLKIQHFNLCTFLNRRFSLNKHQLMESLCWQPDKPSKKPWPSLSDAFLSQLLPSSICYEVVIILKKAYFFPWALKKKCVSIWGIVSFQRAHLSGYMTQPYSVDAITQHNAPLSVETTDFQKWQVVQIIHAMRSWVTLGYLITGTQKKW